MNLFFLTRRYFPRRKHIILAISGIVFLSIVKAQPSTGLLFSSTNEFRSETITYNSLDAFRELKLEEKIAAGKSFKTMICLTMEGRPVELYYFPGTSAKRALLIGGVHGSELSSIELAYHVIEKLLSGIKPEYNVIVIPSLFPDNAAKAILENNGSTGTSGRYSSEISADPNRQMPAPGLPFDPAHPFDLHGRPIETENQYLLLLIQQFRPERIASLHAIRDPEKAGIFADPRTDPNGLALGFASDSLLAASMNRTICMNGGKITSQSADSLKVVYHKDPRPVPPGNLQPRNLQGSNLPNNRGNGISLGSWATTAVNHDDPFLNREAISLLTIEFPGYKSSIFVHNEQKFNYLLNLRLYSLALTSIFLSQ